MTHAHPLPHLADQTPQGGGARFVHRIGAALRGAFAGIAHERRQAAPPPSDADQTAARATEPPKPNRRPRVARQPNTTQPTPPPRPGWIARWFGRKRPQPKPARRSQRPDRDDAPFTPEANPGFTQEVCDILNTPVQDCDPELLYLVLAVFAQCLAESLPPELGMDAKALFSTLWDRLGFPLDQAMPDGAPAAPVDEAPAGPTDAVPPLPEEAQAIALPESSAIITASAPVPASIAVTNPGFHRRRPLRRDLRRLMCARRGFPGRAWRRSQPGLPPPRRLYYACAAPP